MLRPEEAWSRLEPHLAPLPTERLARRRARGRVLAQALAAAVDVPAAAVSAMDGYALAGEVPLGTAMPVGGMIVAGDPPGFVLVPGTAVRIMTGAPVPAGADRVVPVEASDRGSERVVFTRAYPAGTHVRPRGEILHAGQPMLAAGSLLTPGALSLLATHGIAEVAVHRAPRVAVIVTGDEVVPPDQVPAPGQLRDSHSDFLAAAGASLGLDFELLGVVGDDAGKLRERVRQGLAADVLLLTGGVSMGELDLVEGVLAELGCTPLFDSVAWQPGKPLVAAIHPGTPRDGGHHDPPRHGLVFGLPGNPASVMVCFWLFVRPVLRRLLGLADGFWQGTIPATLTTPLAAAIDRDRFLPADLSFAEGRWLATPRSPRGSHDLLAFAHGTGLVRVRAGAPARDAGEGCEVLLVGGG